MITYTNSDIFKQPVEALVNPVNCVGVMGKGLALQFKIKYPANFLAYHAACKARAVSAKRPFVHQTNTDRNPAYIINVATKRHWRDPSTLSDIDSGLTALAHIIQQRSIKSIAIPALGLRTGRPQMGQRPQTHRTTPIPPH